MISVLLVLGTRPEAIKLAPLLLAMRAEPRSFDARLCSTGQHADLLPPTLCTFGIQPDIDLSLMRRGQGLPKLLARVLEATASTIDKVSPDLVVVQGDTVSALGAAQAAFYRGVPVLHVEAGLRTHRREAPFPEEMQRVLLSRLATIHCAPTEEAAGNLRREGIADEQIHVTGNTGIDALLHMLKMLSDGTARVEQTFPAPTGNRIVVTMHRRESFGKGLQQVCSAILTLLEDPKTEVVMPVHLNPEARRVVRRHLRKHPRLRLADPLDYASFVALMRSAHLLITDSGGIQEEAPYLQLPVLVTRECTERPEGVAAGCAEVVGFQPERIVRSARELLAGAKSAPVLPDRHAIYGDGSASRHILRIIHSFHAK